MPEEVSQLLLQVANTKQAARHTQEVEELLLELSKQHAAAQTAPEGSAGSTQAARLQQTALPQPSQADSGRSLPQEEDAEEPSRSLTPLPPRLTTPASPSRPPKAHSWGYHTPPPERGFTPLNPDSVLSEQAQDESLRAERGRSFSITHRWGTLTGGLLSHSTTR